MTEGLHLHDPETVQEIKFTFFYNMFSFWSSGVLVLVCVLSEGVAAFGSVLHSGQFLALGAAYEVGKVGLAKLLSGHSASLNLSTAASASVDSKPIRGPLLRKLWVKLTRLVSRLAPVWHLARGLALLAAWWLALVYLTVCFGAPVSSGWVETGSFCLLVTLLTAYPCLLVLGPSLATLRTVYTASPFSSTSSTDARPRPSVQCLHCVCLVTLLGAWLGATPLPLDWDRDWQVWPVSCCLGAVAGHVLGSVLAAFTVWPLMASVHSSSSRRKFV